MLEELIDRAKERGDEGIATEDAFRLHDTFGFPIDLTLELVAEQGLGVDEAGFESLMDAQRERSRGGYATAGPGAETRGPNPRDVAVALSRDASPTEFVGYEKLEVQTTVEGARGLA